MFHDSLIGLVRTVVPMIVGALIVWLAEAGIELSDEASGAFTVALMAIATSAYYAGVTWLEREVNPSWGYLLGVPKAPSYSASTGDEVSEDVEDIEDFEDADDFEDEEVTV